MSGASLQNVDVSVDLELEGWLYRSRRLFGPYKRRWFVLAGNLLYQYKTPVAPTGIWCRFCKHSFQSLVGAVITSFDENSLLHLSNGKEKMFLRASTAEEQRAWLKALRHASERRYDAEQQNDLSQQYAESVLLALAASFEEMERHSQLSKRRAAELQEYLEEMDPKDRHDPKNYQMLLRKLKLVNLSAIVVIHSSENLLEMAKKHQKTWEASVTAAGLGTLAEARKRPRGSTGSVRDSPAGSAASLRYSGGRFDRRNSSFVWSQKTGFVEVFDDNQDDQDDDSSQAGDQDEFVDALEHLEHKTENHCTIL